MLTLFCDRVHRRCGVCAIGTKIHKILLCVRVTSAIRLSNVKYYRPSVANIRLV